MGGNFALGQVVMTRGISNEVENSIPFTDFVLNSLGRHAVGDWGDLCKEDKQLNNEALIYGDRLVSVYKKGNWKIYIITEWDRSYTTILFPEEY